VGIEEDTPQPRLRFGRSYDHAVTASAEDAKARTAGGFDRIARSYDTVIPFFEAFGRHLVDAASPLPGDRVLDVACGKGACLRVAAEHVGATGYVLGVDLSVAMVDEAFANVATVELPAPVEVRIADAESLDLPDDSFDVVVCGFGVFFFPDPAAALSESRRVLRPGGRFAASTFVGPGGYSWFFDVIRTFRPDMSVQTRSPVATAAGLEDALLRAGFAEPRTVEVEARFLFPDVDAYFSWNWSTGRRQLLETFTDEEHAAYRRESAARLADHAVADGFELVQVVALTTATAP
jgi:ubiquinone/menaquinone biosynthesis C-methylase UbiE